LNPNRNPRNKTPTPIFPSNCNDLNELGHTVDGFYLVQGPNKNQIGVMYCSLMEQDNHRSEMPGIHLENLIRVLKIQNKI